MLRVSPADASPLIAKCSACGHREYAEIQISPPWLPGDADDTPSKAPPKTNATGKSRFRFLDLTATPCSVGAPDGLAGRLDTTPDHGLGTGRSPAVAYFFLTSIFIDLATISTTGKVGTSVKP